jgi:uncharacterized lipoprotein YmbA
MKPKVVLIAFFVLAGTSCSPLAPLADPSRFFLLSPLSEDSTAKTTAPLAQQLAIGVGPIEFPDYLRRSEVVTRTAANRIDVSQRNRWAGPLDKNFARVLSENLATLLNTERVENYPWSIRTTSIDYQVVVDVERFDTGSDHQATLLARWSIRNGRDGKELYATETTSTAPVDSAEEGPSAALSSTLATMSRQVASQVTILSGHPGSVLPSRLMVSDIYNSTK